MPSSTGSVSETARRLDVLDAVVTDAIELGLAHRTAENERLDGRSLQLDGRSLLNFSSCSYLGLETDPRLKDGAIAATRRYGTQFSSSRVYVSAPPYAELERLLSRIFGAHVIATPTTTLGHLSAIPTLIGEDDAVILDHQVHHSVQTAVAQVRSLGVRVELLRHSRMDLLEDRVRALRTRHPCVWYMADGVYSMYGDLAPFAKLAELRERYEQLHLYLDDAHGMSWTGEHGRGVALSHLALGSRTVIATSLNKSFGAAGGVLVFGDAETRRRVRTCGGPLLFSGPIQPPMLGAGIASARLHLGAEIGRLQHDLAERIRFTNEQLRTQGVPVSSTGETPICFVPVGETRAAQELTQRLILDGFYTNVGQFPAVGMRSAGVRFTLTLHQTRDDISSLVGAIARHRPRSTHAAVSTAVARAAAPLRLEVADSIDQVDRTEWNRNLGDRGAFDAAGLGFLEKCFHPGREPENAWRFRYYRVVDRRGRTVLQTFFTLAPWKADMLASARVSEAVEETRKREPDHLVVRTFAAGCLLTEGDHLHLRREEGDWRPALEMLLAAVRDDASSFGAEAVALRDLATDDAELGGFLRERGFIGMPLPDSMTVEVDWRDEGELVERLSPKSRRHQRQHVAPFNDAYDLEVLTRAGRTPSARELEHFFALYRSTKRRSLALNTFELPRDLFSLMLASGSWEIQLLWPRELEPGCDRDLPAAVGACFVGRDQYVPTVLGTDERYVRTHGLYRQCLRHALLRARELGLRRVLLGMGAPLEKRRFGALPRAHSVYLQTDDHFVFDAISQMAGEPE